MVHYIELVMNAIILWIAFVFELYHSVRRLKERLYYIISLNMRLRGINLIMELAVEICLCEV